MFCWTTEDGELPIGLIFMGKGWLGGMPPYNNMIQNPSFSDIPGYLKLLLISEYNIIK